MGLIAIEWVKNYHSLLGNLVNTQKQSEGFYNTLNATQTFAHGDDAANDQHFEQAGAGLPVAGSDTTHVENVDMVYFAGHGTPVWFEFGIELDDARAKPTEIRWGDKRLKWVVVDACDVLFHVEDAGVPSVTERWGQTFRGLRYILGFASLTSDEPDRGRIFAQYLNAGDIIPDAWRKACQETEEPDTTWAYLRADGNGISTDQDSWLNDATASTKPKPPTLFHYLRGAC